ncbi:hypothetical protein GCG54_00011650 [Colletotrichum gloeosporioides]|uniref:Uncharacterized protein n=1 Tax=Colletotrichum gloeosporioides TaxID=474922 RepID=A0A8H4CHF4_COLGL|nr:uncharacterized protein GCG54_00011650 [Colletotrichum gloeosporioides]KAF3803812.1 hypothetical protein GCG54_00011650 [Colletotrichum gloeosporioides]
MVQTRSGKQTQKNVRRAPVVAFDDAQITSMIPNQPARPKAETRPLGRHPADCTIDLRNLSAALRTMDLQNTKSFLGEGTPDDTTAASSQPLDNIPSLFDDTSYLAPDFNPTTLKIPTLRNVLLRHNIPYSPTQTKSVLIEIFISEIQPRAAATLAAMAKVQRDEKGIVDRSSSVFKGVCRLARGQTRAYPGHPEIELALLRFHSATSSRNTYDLAYFFLEERSNPRSQDGKHFYDWEAAPIDRSFWYCQAHAPILQQKTVEGHAVRAMYLLTMNSIIR